MTQRPASLLLAALTVALAPQLLRASAPPQCVRATLSQSAQVLVINDLVFEDPSAIYGRPRTSTFRVFPRSSELNERLRVNGPETYWTSPLWQVSFTAAPGSPVPLCSYALVSNDAEFLVLISSGAEALTIYRRRYHPGQPVDGPWPDPGVLVRHVPSQELGIIPTTMIKDDIPEWFAGGHFDLSSDTLTFTDRFLKRFRIDLPSGKVASAAKP